MTGRGCPNSCAYCCNNYLRKLYPGEQYLRRRSVNNVIRELIIAKERYRIREVLFQDDVFTYDLEWLKEFALKYKKRINLPYFCWSHPRFINKEVVRLLRVSNCRTVSMGVESVNKDAKRTIKRYESLDEVKNAINLFKGSRIFFIINLILGIPGEGIKELKDTVRFFSRNRPDRIAVLGLRRYPKTDIDCRCDSENINITRGGGKISGNYARMQNLILMTQFLPESVLWFFLKRNRYKLLPAINLYNVNALLSDVIGRINGKKHIHSENQIWNYLEKYLYYGIMKWF